METTDIEIGIVQKVMNFLNITESTNSVELYETLTSYRNQLHPDRCYDDESKMEATEKFVKATQLLTDLNSFINRERLAKSPTELVAIEKDYTIVNIQQKVIDKEKIIEVLESKIAKYREIIRNLLEQNKTISKERKETNYEEIRKIYKDNGKIKTGIGLKVAFVFIYSFITSIDQISKAIRDYLPFSQNVLNIIVFSCISVSIIYSIRILIKNKIIEENSLRIETTTLIAKFSTLLKSDHFGSKISEMKIFEFIKSEFTNKKKVFAFLEKIVGANNDVVVEKYKNVFINNLLEKQLIKISKAKSLDREFYVFGTSWSEQMNERKEMKTELVDDSDIDSLLEEE